MADLHGFAYVEVEFTRDGAIFREPEVARLLAALTPSTATDLIVLAHGWNSDRADAARLYDAMAARLRERLGASPTTLGARRFAIAGVLWPSKKFTDPERIPGGGAVALEAVVTTAVLARHVDVMESLLDRSDETQALGRARALVSRLGTKAAQRQFVDLMRGLLPPSFAEEDAGAFPQAFWTMAGDDLLDRLAAPVAGPPEGAVSVGDLIGGIKAGAWRLMNLVTYYQMKQRAGAVGFNGLSEMLRRVRKQRPDLKLHLIGHSFGGRLVTAAATGPAGQAVATIDSMSLLQAAFSHFGFAKDDAYAKPGFFRRMVEQRHVSGAVIITHSDKDLAVGLAYPIVARIADRVPALIGDAHDPYGAIGRNGAQKTPEAIQLELLEPGNAYPFEPGKLHNLRGDTLIRGHMDVTTPAVADAILSAVAAS